MLKRLLRAAAFTVTAAVFVGCATTEGPNEVEDQAADQAALATVSQLAFVEACDRSVEGMHCYAKLRGKEEGSLTTPGTVGGYGPADLVSAYNVPATSASGGKTIAVIAAYDDPTAEADLATYRKQFGLPPCSSASGCFTKLNQTGAASPLPAANAGWAVEMSLDLDMVSAICPDCKILLVEANSALSTDLGAAVNTAAAKGAVAITNSYGGPEYASEPTASTMYYNHPGVLVTVSSGDSGYGTEFPATSPYVLAVGGTTLVKSSSSRGWAESVWSGGGSGCSTYSAKPAWQSDTLCKQRTEADVAAVADPNTGVAIFANGVWEVAGGTSASSPIVAALFTRLGIAGASASVCTSGSCTPYPYLHPSAFYDITTGSNGSCGGSLLCTAGVGIDGPTGLGSPNGASLASPPVVDAGAGTGAKDGGTAADAGAKDAGVPPALTVANTSLSVTAGGSAATTTMTLAGFNAAVSLAAGSLPAGVSVAFSPATIASPGAGAIVASVTATAAAASGSYTATVSASGGGVTKTASLTITVAPAPTFALTVSPSALSVAAGSSGAFTATIARTGNFTSTVTYTVSGIPTGITLTAGAPSATSVPFTAAVSTSAAAGPHSLTVTATGGGITKTATLVLTVTPTFSMTVGPTGLTVLPGSTGSATVSIVGSTGFAAPVAVSVSGMPASVTVTSSGTVTGSGTAKLTITVGKTASSAAFTLTVTASGSGITKTASLPVK